MFIKFYTTLSEQYKKTLHGKIVSLAICSCLFISACDQASTKPNLNSETQNNSSTESNLTEQDLALTQNEGAKLPLDSSMPALNNYNCFAFKEAISKDFPDFASQCDALKLGDENPELIALQQELKRLSLAEADNEEKFGEGVKRVKALIALWQSEDLALPAYKDAKPRQADFDESIADKHIND